MTMTMDTNRNQTDQDEAEIRSLINSWARALEAKDLDAMMANYAPDVLLFDIKPPFQIKGTQAYRADWEACLPYFPEAFTSEYRDLKITVSGDVAFCHGLHHLKPADGAHPIGQTWLRVTACYRKIEGQWRTVHEHVSVPFDPMTERVAYITDDDVAAGAA